LWFQVICVQVTDRKSGVERGMRRQDLRRASTPLPWQLSPLARSAAAIQQRCRLSTYQRPHQSSAPIPHKLAQVIAYSSDSSNACSSSSVLLIPVPGICRKSQTMISVYHAPMNSVCSNTEQTLSTLPVHHDS